MFIHPSSDVQTKNIGEGTRVWQYAVILKGATIGNNCNICSHTFIEDEVLIGNNVTVKSGIYIWNGITIENNVFLGPAVVFTNAVRPRSKQQSKAVPTLIKHGASIGANATILAGITIGKYAMIGLGTVITKDIPDHALVYGSPAKIQGWVDEDGNKLTIVDSDTWTNDAGQRYVKTKNGLQKKQR